MQKKPKTVSDLNRIYQEAETVDKELFADMRSNVLLASGDHYSRKISPYVTRLRENQAIPESTRLRITKNHVYKIGKYYEASVYSHSPGVAVMPRNPGEIQDQKTAELNQAGWAYEKDRAKLKDRFRDATGDFFKLGEVCWIMKWDPSRGELKGYEQEMDEEGMPVVDEVGEPKPDMKKPVMTGQIIYESVYAPNLLRNANCKDMRENDVWIIRKMEDTKVLKERYRNQPDKLKYISDTADDTFIIFDANRSSYAQTKDQCLIKEFYFDRCEEYPNGYFFITTEAGILEEGELPFGIWPIAWAAWDTYPTTPRGYSPIKIMRPYQSEINRASSQLALQQVTLGDDKIIYQAGTKLAAGALLPGVRGLTYQGVPPTVLQGRDGSQFLAYIESTISEMYSVMMVDELQTEKAPQQSNDMMVELYKSMRQKTKFSAAAEKFEQFMIDVCNITLQLAKKYWEDDTMIPAFGRSEYINIAEFKNSDPIHFRIKLEPQDETLETKMGKQLTLNQIIQYAGSNMERDDIGRLIKAMPFANAEEAFGDLTLDYENAKNLMLQIERGEKPIIHPGDNAAYMIKKLSNRMKKPDYDFLAQDVQQLYDQVLAYFTDLEAEQQQKILAAKNEYIPASGPLVACDIYVENKEDPNKEPKRARIPTQALQWLMNQLENQGMSQAQVDMQDAATQAQIAEKITNQPLALPPGQGAGQMAGMPGQA